MRPRHRPFRALLACCILLSALASLPWIAPPSVAAGTAYTIIDLGTLRPDNSGRGGANGVNTAGQVVGAAAHNSDNTFIHAYLRDPGGTKHDLGPGSAQAINASGVVVGTAQFAPASAHAALWEVLPDGSVAKRDLGTLAADNSGKSEALDISDQRIVVGISRGDDGGEPRAIRWKLLSDGGISKLDLGTLNRDFGSSFARAINAEGEIVGEADSPHGFSAVRWQIGTDNSISKTDLGGMLIDGRLSSAYDINDAGDIVGIRTITTGSDVQGTLWQVARDGSVSYRHLPSLLEGRGGISFAKAVNNATTIVGDSSIIPRPTSGVLDYHAVRWQLEPDGSVSIVDLNGLISPGAGWELLQANDINDAGQIVGFGRHNGEDHGYLLNPVEGNTLALTTRNSATGRLDAREFGTVAVTPTPAPGPYATGTVVTLTAQPKASGIFTGWVVDGTFRGWATTLRLTIAGDHTVQASFGPRTNFTDVPQDEPAREAIQQLAARGIVVGYGYAGCRPPPTYPCFGPGDPVRRAQLPAMLVRALGWQGEPQSTEPFSDLGNIDAELWRAISILAAKGVVKGYGDGRFGPGDEVSRAQAISMITRAMVAAGYWEPVTVDDPALYPNIPAGAPHRLDILTYAARVGAVPYDPPSGNWPEWLLPGSRAWTAQALWQALDSTFGP